MKKNKLVYSLTVFVLVFFAACENPIMKKWWEEPEPKEPEVEYIPIVKMVPQVTYETIIEHEFIYQTIIEKVPEYIYETIVQENTIYETVMEKVPEYVYEVIRETEYVTIYETIYERVETIVVTPPAREDVIQYIKDNVAEVVEIIKEQTNWKEILKEIIKEIPPGEITQYLTDEQVKYIIQQQPPQVILQTITIINIEYIIFSGDASVYNGNSPTGGTSLTTQERSANDTTIAAMAKALVDHSDYLMILHGHANPVTSSPTEIAELMSISTDRANTVDTVLKTKFGQLGGDTLGWDTRVSASGYGGEKNLSVTNSTYAGLNRRVEMILVRVGI
jgi:outer membrane protein OmpA-like peptidoglycan-associated protein